jgi:hypothetical protein
VPAEYLGFVEPPDEKSALNDAVKEFHIKVPEQQKGLMALREG